MAIFDIDDVFKVLRRDKEKRSAGWLAQNLYLLNLPDSSCKSMFKR